MKSMLQFLNSHKTLLAQIVLVILFIGVLAWGASITTSSFLLTQNEEQETSQEEGELSAASGLSPVAATTPVEFTPNQNETDGIIFAGVVLVLIIVVGTLGVIRQRG